MTPKHAVPTTNRPVGEGDLDWPVESIDSDGVTELRVHGVGGTPPTAMLDEAGPRQVTGDQVAGVWRGADRLVNGARRWHREAYSWGGLTSRPLSSALWLMLLPFSLINLAGWMALGNRGPESRTVEVGVARLDWRVAFQQALVRVIALAATWTYVLFAGQLSMDLAAWQCTRSASCRIEGWWRFIGLAGHPARGTTLAALVPVLAVVGLALLSRQSRQRYEDYRPAGDDRPRRLNVARIMLSHRHFWSGAVYAERSRTLHITSSFLLIAALLLAVAEPSGRHHDWTRGAQLAVLGLLGVCALCAAWVWLRKVLFSHHRSALVVALAILAGAATLTWLQPARPAGTGMMPGVLTAFDAIIVGVYAFALLHLGIAGWAWWSVRRTSWAGPAPFPGPFVAIALALWLMFAVLSGVVVWIARWLSPDAVPIGRTTAGDLVYPSAYTALAQVSVAGLVVVAGVVGVFALGSFLVTRWFGRLNFEATVWEVHELAGGQRASTFPAWRRALRTRLWTAGVARWIEAGLVAAAVVATGGSLFYSGRYAYDLLGRDGALRAAGALLLVCVAVSAFVALALDRRGFWRFAGRLLLVVASLGAAAWIARPLLPLPADRPTARVLEVPLLTEAVASTVLTALPILAVLAVRRAIRHPGTRRLVATAWDVATFWPRAFHPFAPPSYAERAVPELACRVSSLLDRGHAVLLLAHSQGAMLVTATLAMLGPDLDGRGARLSVITYGNPVAHLYMRWFPGYVNSSVVEYVRSAVPPGQWVNFFRYTDPVGRELFAAARRSGRLPTTVVGPDGGDCWLPDPPTDLYRRGDGQPRVRGHTGGDYLRQSTFADHLRTQVAQLDTLAE